jgi:uncharacterized membrane protein (TIGR02234 family)
VGLLILAALAMWGASRMTWSWSIQPTPLHGNVVAPVDGRTATPALVPLALLSLAAVAALFAVGGWLRRIIGALLLIAGIAVLWLGINDLGGVFGAHPNGYPRWQILGAHGLTLVGGVLLAIVGVLVVRAATALPKLGARYEASAGTRKRANPDAELWQALSEGRDPTEDRTEPNTQD